MSFKCGDFAYSTHHELGRKSLMEADAIGRGISLNTEPLTVPFVLLVGRPRLDSGTLGLKGTRMLYRGVVLVD